MTLWFIHSNHLQNDVWDKLRILHVETPNNGWCCFPLLELFPPSRNPLRNRIGFMEQVAWRNQVALLCLFLLRVKRERRKGGRGARCLKKKSGLRDHGNQENNSWLPLSTPFSPTQPAAGAHLTSLPQVISTSFTNFPQVVSFE